MKTLGELHCLPACLYPQACKMLVPGLAILLHAVNLIPQTVLALRGSYGVAKAGAMVCLRIRPRCRGAFSIVKMLRSWHLPSKTQGKVNILKELLHSVREGCYFYELPWLRPPWPPQMPGPSRTLQEPPPDASRITVWGLALGSYIYIDMAKQCKCIRNKRIP